MNAVEDPASDLLHSKDKWVQGFSEYALNESDGDIGENDGEQELEKAL